MVKIRKLFKILDSYKVADEGSCVMVYDYL